jgi:hypothetical protein
MYHFASSMLNLADRMISSIIIDKKKEALEYKYVDTYNTHDNQQNR